MESARNQDTLAILVKNIRVDMHHHHAVQLVVSLDHPYQAVLDGQSIASTRGFLIDSNIPHACQSEAATVLVISVDATSAKGRVLKQQLASRRLALLDELFSINALDRFSKRYWHYHRDRTVPFDPLEFVYVLCDGNAMIEPLDPRVLAAIEFINQNINRTIPVAAIAHHVGLSESRLRHLFAERVGISIASYVLWTRIKIALKEMLKPGAALADAAHHANFADQAHFTRVFKRMFGVAPSLLLHHGQFLHVFGI